MSTTWDLNRIRYTIRKLTGRFDTSQLPDTTVGEVSVDNPAGIDDYINDFYLYDMPEHFRTLKLRDFYTFTTIPNCGTYSIPQNIIQIYDPIFFDNYQGAWHQYPETFYRIWPELNFIDRNLFTPDGTSGTSSDPFFFTLTQTPIQQGTVVIGLTPNLDGSPSPALETFTDEDQPIPLDVPKEQFFVNPGVLTGNQGGTGTIDYLTGAVSLSYATAPPDGTNSSCHYHPYQASRPRDALFWQQQVLIRPIPNDTYIVKMMAYVLPTTVINAATNATQYPSLYTNPTTGEVIIQGFSGNSGSQPTDLPQFNEWWQLIAYGAAIKILKEDGDHEEIAFLEKYFEEQKLLAQRKTLRQLGAQRIQSRYAENQNVSPPFPVFPIY